MTGIDLNKHLRRKALLRQALLFCLLLTVIMVIVCTVFSLLVPMLSLPQMLWLARFGLLAWRLCLYAACGVCWFSLYRRLPSEQRPRLRCTAIGFLVLLVVNEFCNFLQWGEGI